MIHIIKYKVGTSDEIKLAQVESEDITSATEKANNLFLEFELNGYRKHRLIDVLPLNSIRKLDALE